MLPAARDRRHVRLAQRTEKAPSALPPDFSADAFDRRIVSLIAFGPAVAMLALIAATGRGAVSMWGYPLWLFCGLWIVLFVPRTIDALALDARCRYWSAVFAALVLAFHHQLHCAAAHRSCYRAEFFPGMRWQRH